MALESGAQVDFQDVSVTIGAVPILESISASVTPGSTTAIIGPNGAGKTTLILALLGQIQYGGRIRISLPRSAATVRVGYVPQRLDFDRGLPLTVMDYMAMGSQRRPLWLGTARRLRGRALELLAQVKAEHLAGRRLGALSGGELQRVQLALALTRDPHLLVLDEPAAGVDIRGGQLLCELLEHIQRERGFTQLMVTHDLPLVTAHASHVICLNHRVTGAGATRQTLRPAVLAATFGLHLGLPDPAVIPAPEADAAQDGCGGHAHD
jgi:zinc transport system ATP-binding protein